MAPNRRLVAIVGAGFCGTLMAARLLRQPASSAFDIALINRAPAPGAAATPYPHGMARGLAYGTNSPDHLLNVPAGRMSAFDEAPRDFEDYLRQHGADVGTDGSSFAARHWYGSYLQTRLEEAAQAAGSANGPRLTTHQATVTSLVRADDGRFVLTLAKGNTNEVVVADRVVLALGNFMPSNPSILDSSVYRSPHYLRDPWHTDALSKLNIDEPVLLIGSGLTMLDVALSLKRRASTVGKPLRLLAISRRGLLPQAHRIHTEIPDFQDAPLDIAATPTARHYLRSIRRQVEKIVATGGDWRNVVASLRPLTPQLWRALSNVERQRFCRHLRPYWESHRHRAAPQSFNKLTDLLASGELRVNAARLINLHAAEGGVIATIRARGSSELTQVRVGTVVNCTGPSSHLHSEPLLADLQSAGRICADPLGLGLIVADDYRVLDSGGQVWNGVYYVGPLLKAGHWEATAVPELRGHVASAAVSICASLGGHTD